MAAGLVFLALAGGDTAVSRADTGDGGSAPLPAECPWLRLTPCPSLPPPPPPPSCGAACRKLSEQLDRGCTESADAPYADTIFLRRTIRLSADADTRARLALASLAETPEGAERVLGDLLSAPETDLRFAAAVQLALAASRADAIGGPSGVRARAVMDEIDDLPFPRSDARFFDALAHLEAGEPQAALTAAQDAGRLEPRFFNAHVLVLRILMTSGEAVAGRRSDRAACAAEFDALLTALAAIADLEPCPRVAAHLEQFLARQLRSPEAAPGFSAAQVYLGILSRHPDLARRAFARVADDPSLSCRAAVLPELDSFLALASRSP